jgi:hypothetical protein
LTGQGIGPFPFSAIPQPEGRGDDGRRTENGQARQRDGSSGHVTQAETRSLREMAFFRHDAI